VANRHFGRLGDVWKHLPLCEVLAQERPSLYAETHAGSAAYEALDNAERRYGVRRFDAVAERDSALTHSRYAVHLRRVLGEGYIPGSPLLAMRELGTSSRYVLCDMDPGSTKDLSTWADRLGLADRVTTVELTARLIASGVGVMYWYGFDAPDQRRWAMDALGEATDDALWCGDMLVTTADGAARDDGHLGRATTPGTGFGIVLANVSQASTDRCQALGAALARAYDGAPLPDGRAGALDFLVSTAT
jgi:hypothetical protein